MTRSRESRQFKAFLQRDSPADMALSRPVYIDGVGHQTRLLSFFRRCPGCPSFAARVVLRDREYFAFTFHVLNLRIGQRLFLEFLYDEQNDFSGWTLMRYGVDSHLCRMPNTAILLPMGCV